MKKFIVEGTEYTVTKCTAIALCDIENGNRQPALHVVSYSDGGERFDDVVFGWDMPESKEDYLDMCEDSGAWESDYTVVESIENEELQ